jgi:hypothetical protein
VCVCVQRFAFPRKYTNKLTLISDMISHSARTFIELETHKHTHKHTHTHTPKLCVQLE